MLNIKSASIVICAILLASCQSAPKNSVSYLQIQLAATEVIQEYIAINTLCDHPDYKLTESTAGLYNQWLDEHWDIITGADSFYWSTQSRSLLNYDDITFSQPAIVLLRQQRQHAEKAAKQRFGRINSAACEQALTEYSATNLQDTIEERELLAYAKQHPALPTPGSLIPSLGKYFLEKSEPGHSQFTVEKIGRRLGCSQPLVHTIKNQWPEEAYALICPQIQHIIICEWGNCKVIEK